MFSFYYPSRLDFRLANGTLYDNENLRTNTHGLTFHDGYSGQYAYIHIDRSPDVADAGWGACPAKPSAQNHGHRGKRRHRAPKRRSQAALRGGRGVRFTG
jgi:hypothetical protein